jgi:squalene cyclase
MEPRDYIAAAMFGISMLGAAASYFKAMSDVRNEIQVSIGALAEKLRDETRSQYATKEETRFQHEILIEIKSQLKELNMKLEQKRLV